MNHSVPSYTAGSNIQYLTEGQLIDMATGGNDYSNAISSFFSSSFDTTDVSKPHAYLVWMLYDNDMKLIPSGSGVQRVTDPNALEELIIEQIPIEADGYLHAYVSNGSASPVTFDNFLVTYIRGKTRQINHYYPYGLSIDGLDHSDEYLNKYTSKELQTGEFDPALSSGLEMFDFGSRFYDPQVGRWFTPDPAEQFHNPYLGIGNNPVMYVDPDGEFVWVPILIGAAMGAYSGYQIGQAQGATGSDLFGYALLGGIIGGVSGGIGAGVATGVSAGIGGVAGGIAGTAVGGGVAGGINGYGMAAMSGGDVGKGFVSGLASGFAAGAVGGSLGAIAPSFSNASLAGRYAGKALYAGFTGAASVGAGMFAGDLADNGRIDLKGKDYLKGMGTGAALGAGISLAYSAYDYITWDRHSNEHKVALLNKEFKTGVLKYDSDDPNYGGYRWRSDEISLGKKSLANRAIARNTVAHEFQHYNDFKSGLAFNRNYLEHRAHLLDMRLAPSQNLPGRYWVESRLVLKSYYGYNGPFPNTYGPGQIWFNIFR